MSTVWRIPLVGRIAWHARRVAREHHLTRRFFLLVAGLLAAVVVGLALLVTLAEGPHTWHRFEESLYWSGTTVLGQGDAGFVTSRTGYLAANALALVGVGLLSVLTAAVVSFAVDLMVKEGQGMGAAQYRGHVVVCGWNETARHLVDELRSDDYAAQLVVLSEADRNPAGSRAYFVHGDSTDAEDLRRAGVHHAAVVVVCPADTTVEADMHTVFVVLAVRAEAPTARIVAEANHERAEEHLRRAGADEIVITTLLASHLAARAALFPGVSRLVTELVSGGPGHEIYRIRLPDDWAGLQVGEVSGRLWDRHGANLLALTRDGTHLVALERGATVATGQVAYVVAESLDALAPLEADSPVRLA